MLRNRLRVIIIDEIFMVSNALLLHVYLRLVEIFGCTDNTPFTGVTVIAAGHFMQLSPVKARPVYVEFKNSCQIFVSICKLFKIAELTEVMQ